MVWLNHGKQIRKHAHRWVDKNDTKQDEDYQGNYSIIQSCNVKDCIATRIVRVQAWSQVLPLDWARRTVKR